MIRDARVLRAGFVPREVEHRDAEVNHLSSVLEPITNREPADTAIVTGPSGTGKTSRTLAVHPGQDIEYVVVDDEKSSRERVALAHEEIETYDASYYETQLVRAVESVLSPLGWDGSDIRRELNGTRVAGITDWT